METMQSSPLEQLHTTVTRTYTVGLRFEGQTPQERRQQESRAYTIIQDLQRAITDKITPERMDQTLDFIREQPTLAGTQGAAQVAKLFEDRSNIGQVAYLTLLNAAKGTLDRERKIGHFIQMLSEEPPAAVEWLVFGRTPFLEWRLQHRLQVAYDYSRNLIYSARRTVENHLPEGLQLTQPLPPLSEDEVLITRSFRSSLYRSTSRAVKKPFKKSSSWRINTVRPSLRGWSPGFRSGISSVGMIPGFLPAGNSLSGFVAK